MVGNKKTDNGNSNDDGTSNEHGNLTYFGSIDPREFKICIPEDYRLGEGLLENHLFRFHRREDETIEVELMNETVLPKKRSQNIKNVILNLFQNIKNVILNLFQNLLTIVKTRVSS